MCQSSSIRAAYHTAAGEQHTQSSSKEAAPAFDRTNMQISEYAVHAGFQTLGQTYDFDGADLFCHGFLCLLQKGCRSELKL